MMRLLAIIEAVLLFAAAATYGAGSVMTALLLMLGAYHWVTIAIIGICAAAAVACLVLAVQLLVKPHPNLMIAGLVFLAMACVVGAKLMKV